MEEIQIIAVAWLTTRMNIRRIVTDVTDDMTKCHGADNNVKEQG